MGPRADRVRPVPEGRLRLSPGPIGTDRGSRCDGRPCDRRSSLLSRHRRAAGLEVRADPDLVDPVDRETVQDRVPQPTPCVVEAVAGDRSEGRRAHGRPRGVEVAADEQQGAEEVVSAPPYRGSSILLTVDLANPRVAFPAVGRPGIEPDRDRVKPQADDFDVSSGTMPCGPDPETPRADCCRSVRRPRARIAASGPETSDHSSGRLRTQSLQVRTAGGLLQTEKIRVPGELLRPRLCSLPLPQLSEDDPQGSWIGSPARRPTASRARRARGRGLLNHKADIQEPEQADSNEASAGGSASDEQESGSDRRPDPAGEHQEPGERIGLSDRHRRSSRLSPPETPSGRRAHRFVVSVERAVAGPPASGRGAGSDVVIGELNRDPLSEPAPPAVARPGPCLR